MAISGASRSVETHVHVPSNRDPHVVQHVYRGRNARARAFPTARAGGGFAFTCHTLGEAILFGPKRLFVPGLRGCGPG